MHAFNFEQVPLQLSSTFESQTTPVDARAFNSHGSWVSTDLSRMGASLPEMGALTWQEELFLSPFVLI